MVPSLFKFSLSLHEASDGHKIELLAAATPSRSKHANDRCFTFDGGVHSSSLELDMSEKWRPAPETGETDRGPMMRQSINTIFFMSFIPLLLRSVFVLLLPYCCLSVSCSQVSARPAPPARRVHSWTSRHKRQHTAANNTHHLPGPTDYLNLEARQRQRSASRWASAPLHQPQGAQLCLSRAAAKKQQQQLLFHPSLFCSHVFLWWWLRQSAPLRALCCP
jgi:hypothetical protein